MNELMTVKEVCEYYKCQPNTVHNLCKRGFLTRIKIGRGTRIKKSEVIAYVERFNNSDDQLGRMLGV